MTRSSSDEVLPGAQGLNTVSVVIPNFNYGRFLGDAVRSALALDWPHRLQVIVVDDGSTDNSIEVLAEFSGLIEVIQQENAGPRVACNRGYAVSNGDAVIFLDSDDVLDPAFLIETSKEWCDGISKVQVQMRRIDASGRPLEGRVFPSTGMRMDHKFRSWLLQTSAYPTPPGSGNIYSRSFLDKMFPVDGSCGDSTDSALLAAAPVLGVVRSIERPLVGYRIHDSNRSRLSNVEVFAKQLERATQRQELTLSLAGIRSATAPLAAVRRSRHVLQMRVAAFRLSGNEGQLEGDNWRRLAADALKSPFHPGPETIIHRIIVIAWCALVLLGPIDVVSKIVRRRFH